MRGKLIKLLYFAITLYVFKKGWIPEKLQHFVQLDRGVSIPGAPVGCDFEIGEDYSMGKFEKMYGNYLSDNS